LAEEVHGDARRLRLGQQPQEQVNAGHPLRQRGAQHPPGPHHGLSVREDQIAAGDRLGEPFVAPHVDQLRGVDHADLQLPSVTHRFETALDGLVHRQRIQLDAEQLPTLRHIRPPCQA
jgi:hypothetical protein